MYLLYVFVCLCIYYLSIIVHSFTNGTLFIGEPTPEKEAWLQGDVKSIVPSTAWYLTSRTSVSAGSLIKEVSIAAVLLL